MISRTAEFKSPASDRPLHWGVWAAQVVLALLYFAAGLAKLMQPMEALSAMGMGFVDNFPEFIVRLIGLAEVLGAAGLILPAATRIKPYLTPLAALGLALLQVGAMITHVVRGEYPNLIVNLVLLALALFIYWGRSQRVPIAPR